MPSVAGGKLFVRDEEEVAAYDIQENRRAAR
jgi:hypothetical protein